MLSCVYMHLNPIHMDVSHTHTRSSLSIYLYLSLSLYLSSLVLEILGKKKNLSPSMASKLLFTIFHFSLIIQF